MKLLVDVGNTRIKWVVWGEPGVLERGDLIHKGLDPSVLGQRLWTDLTPPSQAMIANVAGPKMANALSLWIREAWAIPVQFAVSESSGFGLRSAYARPGDLGVDRWVAMIGAKALSNQHCCVVDCGTAVTIDALTVDGEHQGGVIFPGIRLMRLALYRDTQQIPPEDNGQPVFLGKGTRDCVWGGTVYAVAGAIDSIVRHMKGTLGTEASCFLTGGDGPVLLPYLQEEYRLEPDLIFHGLWGMAEDD